MANCNETSAFLAICSVGFFRKRWWVGLVAIVFGLYCAKAMVGIVAVTAAAMAYLAAYGSGYKFWLAFLSVCAALIVVLIFFPTAIGQENYASANVRVMWWEQGIGLWLLNYPVSGFGIGNWKTIYPHLVNKGYLSGGSLRLHNSYIHGLIEMGWPFGLFVLAYIVRFFHRLTSQAESHSRFILPVAGLVAVAVTCLTNSMFRMNAINAMFAVTWLSIFKTGVEV